MPDPIAVLFVFLASVFVFLAPPALVVWQIARRRTVVPPGLWRILRACAAAAGVVLAVNAALLLTNPTRPTEEGIRFVHFVAFTLSWTCLCGSIALATLVRRRKRVDSLA